MQLRLDFILNCIESFAGIKCKGISYAIVVNNETNVCDVEKCLR